MTAPERVSQIFRDALDRPPGEWDTFLRSAADGDEGLVRQVKALLDADQEAARDGFMSHPIFDVASRLLSAGPRRLGPYELLEELGRGGMALVYKARDVRDGHLVALKFLAPALLYDPAARARLRRECEALSRVDSPHVVRLLGTETIGGVEVLALEYVAGRTLAAAIQAEGPFPAERACRALADVARGLAAAHQRGVVHRDLKPGNIMLTPDGQARLLDFGVAALADASLALTGPGAGLGTMDYIAPEQIDSASDVGPAADWYSFGCVAYCLLTGRPPFADRPTEAGKLLGHKMLTPPKLSPAQAPGPLADLVEALLAKAPASRPGSEEALRVLEAAVAPIGEPIPPAPPGFSWFAWACFSLLLLAGVVAGVALGMSGRSGEGTMEKQLEVMKQGLEFVVVACGAVGGVAVLVGRARRFRWVFYGVVVVGLCAAVGAGAFWAATWPTGSTPALAPQVSPYCRPWKDAADYLASAPPEEREQCRFLSLAHLAEDEREQWRSAISAWVRASFPGSEAQALGEGQAVLVLRLKVPGRDVKEVWDELVAGDPYAMKSDAADDPELREAFVAATKATRTSVPVVRGDWFLSVMLPDHPLAERYRRPLGLEQAAAELGASPEALTEALRDASDGLGIEGLLRGRAVSRDVWAGRIADTATRFQVLASRLGIGYPLTH